MHPHEMQHLRPGLQSCGLVAQNRQSQPVFVSGLRASDLRLGLLELRLAELHNRAEA